MLGMGRAVNLTIVLSTDLGANRSPLRPFPGDPNPEAGGRANLAR